MLYLAGTSGFSYKAWCGSFYPERIAPGEMLEYYAQRLPACEIDNTFYRMPRAEVLAGWASQVPADFRFAIKASRRITHFKRLKDAGEETAYLLRVVRELGPRLGGLLFQLPPNLKKDRDRLARFLDLLPAEVPAAFEFREPSWFEADTLELLRERGRPLCVVDGLDNAGAASGAAAAPAIAATADWGYLRLRRESYDDDALRAWARGIAATGWTRALVFFKHEDEGAAPALARRFLDLVDPAGPSGASSISSIWPGGPAPSAGRPIDSDGGAVAPGPGPAATA